MKFGDLSSLHLNTTVKQKILRETKINVFKIRRLAKTLRMTYSDRMPPWASPLFTIFSLQLFEENIFLH